MNKNKVQVLQWYLSLFSVGNGILFFWYCNCSIIPRTSSAASLHDDVQQKQQKHDDDEEEKEEVCDYDHTSNNDNDDDNDNDDNNIIVPYSYSLHRNSTYHISQRRFSFTTNGGSLTEVLGIDSITINQNFRSDGTGLGSAQWDGSFVLAEALQRLDFSKVHDRMDQLLLQIKQLHNAKKEEEELVVVQKKDHTDIVEQQQQQQQPKLLISLPVLSQVKIERRYQRKLRREELRRQQGQQQEERRKGQEEKEPPPRHDVVFDSTKQAIRQQQQQQQQQQHPWQNMNTIELGSGLGLVSLVTCLMGATSIATDGDESVLDHARWNILYNLKQQQQSGSSHIQYNNISNDASSFSSSSSGSWIPCKHYHPHNNSSDYNTTTTGRVKTTSFLWGDRSKAMELLEDLSIINGSNKIIDDVDINGNISSIRSSNNNNTMDTKAGVVVDFILAADVVYGYDKDSGNKRLDTFHKLVQSLVDLCDHHNKKTVIILAYKPRRPSEHIFFDMMSKQFESAILDPKLLHSDFSTNNNDMNIYLFRLKSKQH